MDNRYSSHRIQGTGKTKEEAWHNWLQALEQFIEGTDYSENWTMGWRSLPLLINDRDFESNAAKYLVDARIIVDSYGEPVPVLQPRNYDEGLIFGLGLAQNKP